MNYLIALQSGKQQISKKENNVKRLIAIVIAVVVVMAFTVPAMADVGTSVTVISGAGSAPVVKALWVSDTQASPAGESGDTSHSVLGVQIKPNLGFQKLKDVTFWAVATDLGGVANITNVYADVYELDGTTLKFEVKLPNFKTDDPAYLEYFDPAYAAGPIGSPIFGMTTVNVAAKDPQTGALIDKADIDEELNQQLAGLWYGTYSFDNCQLDGRYKVVINAFNGQGQVGSFQGWMDWIAYTAADIDFTSINYGNVPLNPPSPAAKLYKQVGGDRIWETPGPAGFPSATNHATIANAGNTFLKLQVKQDDLGLGQTVIAGVPTWNVRYAFRMGDGDISQPSEGIVYYEPVVAKPGAITPAMPWATTYQTLKLCAIEKVDFFISVDKDITPGTEKTGTMVVGFANGDPGTSPPAQGVQYIPPAVPTPKPSP